MRLAIFLLALLVLAAADPKMEERDVHVGTHAVGGTSTPVPLFSEEKHTHLSLGLSFFSLLIVYRGSDQFPSSFPMAVRGSVG